MNPKPSHLHFSNAPLSALLLVVLFAFQVRFPPLSYPAVGQLLLIMLAGIIMLTAARVRIRKNTQDHDSAASAVALRHAALLPGFLFVAWTVARWAFDGAPADGIASVGTTLWAGAYFVIAFMFIPARAQIVPDKAIPPEADMWARLSESPLPHYLLRGLCLMGLICGAYAVAQYLWLYQESHDDLLLSIGARPPDRTESALLHHLKLRRVASFWGDPNSYAAFAALAFTACLEIFSIKSPRQILWQTLAAISMVVGIAGLFHTGSRGGILDLIIGLGLYACLAAVVWRHNRRLSSVFILFLLPLFLGFPGADSRANPPVPGQQAVKPGWTWRSDTIRERIYYLEVGAKMITMAPIAGLGPGSINDYFGRLKNPAAREARHLHNWPVNTWAELGAVGLGLLLWFLGTIVFSAWRCKLWRQPVYRCFAVLFCILMFDGLLQTSWAQRELMCLFGIICAVLVAATATPVAVTRSIAFRRSGAAVALSLTMLMIGIPYLTAASNKQIAADAMLANQPEIASKYWEKASRWVPRDPEPYQARAQLAILAGNLSAANMLLNHALRLAPESAVMHSQAANLSLLMQQPQRAEAQMQRAIKLYPSHPQYNLQYARFLQQQGRVSAAIDYASRARKYSFEADEQAEITAFLKQLYTSQKEKQDGKSN